MKSWFLPQCVLICGFYLKGPSNLRFVYFKLEQMGKAEMKQTETLSIFDFGTNDGIFCNWEIEKTSMRFSKCEFCQKMRIWKCEFCQKWDFEIVNFVKNLWGGNEQIMDRICNWTSITADKKRIGIFVIANEKLEFHETQKSAEYMKWLTLFFFGSPALLTRSIVVVTGFLHNLLDCINYWIGHHL